MRPQLMSIRLRNFGVAAAVGVTIVATCALAMAGAQPAPEIPAEPNVVASSSAAEVLNEPIQPIHQLVGVDPRKIAFGQRLFADKRLSRDGTIACLSCHRPDHGDADDVALSAGSNGHLTKVNTPTIRNSRYSVAQFWDGRAATLEDQIDYPLQNPDEMATTWPDAIARLQADRSYVTEAESIYGTALSPALVKDAIATYERSLVSLNSRFDAYLRGHDDALTQDEKDGYRLFKEYGCASCHQGAAVGGNMFQQMGLFGDYFADRQTPETPADLGRFNVTGDEADRHVFKVPSLRNVTLTAPYFHDGFAPTLEAAIAIMARYQLGRSMTAGDINLIVAFLATLSADPATASQ